MEPVPSTLRPTLAEIARRAGVAKSTASRALSGSPKAAAATAARIRALADALGYRPDPILAQLGRARWKPAAHTGQVLAYLTSGGRDPARSALATWPGLTGAAERLGLRLEWFDTTTHARAQRLEQILLSRGIRGIVLEDHRFEPPLQWDWSRFTVVSLGQSFYRTGFHGVLPDHRRILSLAWQQAVGTGARRIGLWIDPYGPADAENELFQAQFLYAQRQLPAGRRLPPLVASPAAQPDLRAWLTRWRPDLLIINQPDLATVLRRLGQRIPEELQVISLSLDRRLHGGQLAAVDPNMAEVGRTAIEWLAGQMRIHRHGCPATQNAILVTPVWCPGASCRSAPPLAPALG